MTDEALVSWFETGHVVAAFIVAIGVGFEFLLTWRSGPLRTRVEAAYRLKVAEAQAATVRDLLALKTRVGERVLLDDQRATLVSLLKQSSDKTLVRLTVQASDTEADQYAGKLQEVLAAAGWHFTPPRRAVIYPPPGARHVGLMLGVHDPRNPPASARALHHAFTSVGIEVIWDVNQRLEGNDVEILVNDRPM